MVPRLYVKALLLYCLLVAQVTLRSANELPGMRTLYPEQDAKVSRLPARNADDLIEERRESFGHSDC